MSQNDIRLEPTDMVATPNDPTISGVFPQNVYELYWVANYDNGDKLEQFNADGTENQYKDINRERLIRFDMVEKQTKKVVYALYLHDGQQLIFRRRTLKKINRPDTVIFLIGYQMTVMLGSGSKQIVVINYIHPDGSIALDGARSNLELHNFEY